MEALFIQIFGSLLILSVWHSVCKTMLLFVYKQLLTLFINFTFS